MTEEENNYMTSKNTNHNSFISRRRLLGTTLAGGLGITGVGLVTGKGVNKKQVPITRDNDGVARTTKIPRAVYERDMHVKNMAEVMSNRRKKNKKYRFCNGD